jgi:hypothetical protein
MLAIMIPMEMTAASATSRPCALEEFGLLIKVSLGWISGMAADDKARRLSDPNALRLVP